MSNNHATHFFNCFHDGYDFVGWLEATAPPCSWVTLGLLTSPYPKDCLQMCFYAPLPDGIGWLGTCIHRGGNLFGSESCYVACLLSMPPFTSCSLAQIRRQRRYRGDIRPLISTYICEKCCDWNPCPGHPYLWATSQEETLSNLTERDVHWISRVVAFQIRRLSTQGSKNRSCFEIYNICRTVAEFIPPVEKDSLDAVNYARRVSVKYESCVCCIPNYGLNQTVKEVEKME